MTAYVIADVQITDPEAYGEYVRATPETIAAHGGRFVVRGGPVEVLEGDWKPGRVVVIEFENAERARAWFSSAIYAGPRDLRRAASHGSLILVEGT